jgi:hypothetical protein
MIDHKLHTAIATAIATAEVEEGYSLPAETVGFLLDTYEEFVLRGITKFIRGAIEHGDNFLTDLDHIDEAYVETIDQLSYISAARYIKRLHDQRYNTPS